MYLPDISAFAGRRKSQKQIIQFGGLNHTQAASEGELADASGVSARMWPCLTTRPGRTLVRETVQGSALMSWGKLVSVEGSDLLYGGEVVGAVTPGKKQFAVVNTKLCIFPDKKYIDTSTGELRPLEGKVTNREGTEAVFTQDTLTMARDAVTGEIKKTVISIRPKMERTDVRKDKGWVFDIKTYKSVAWDKESKTWETEGERESTLIMGGAEGLAGRYVILRETEDGEMEINLQEVEETWEATGTTSWFSREVADPYGADNEKGIYGIITQISVQDESASFYNEYYAASVRITVEIHDAEQENDGFEKAFEPGDYVWISGSTVKENNREDAPLLVKKVEGRTITFEMGDGEKFTAGTVEDPVTVQGKIPDLDFICESGNRLWGASNKDKTVYASALGNPKTFYLYDGATVGNSMLSYAVPVGTDGDFTAIYAYGSNVLCWKENCLHKVLGTMPSNYELYTYQIAGVQAGSEGSLQIINEVLYYKGREGVYAYTGGTPQLISMKLGLVNYTEAVGGHDGRSYYLSMKRSDNGEWETLNYGVGTGIWVKEGAERVLAFATLEGALYSLTEDGIFRREGDRDGEKPIAWEATFAPFDETAHNKKGYSKLLLRLELDEGAWVEVDVSADNGPFKTVYTARELGGQAMVVPIRPGRCDRFQVRLRGLGGFVLRSMVREFKMGSVW